MSKENNDSAIQFGGWIGLIPWHPRTLRQALACLIKEQPDKGGAR